LFTAGFTGRLSRTVPFLDLRFPLRPDIDDLVDFRLSGVSEPAPFGLPAINLRGSIGCVFELRHDLGIARARFGEFDPARMTLTMEAEARANLTRLGESLHCGVPRPERAGVASRLSATAPIGEARRLHPPKRVARPSPGLT
jgi:hypothetical protein